MKKIVIKFPEKCTGCELCVLETQRQLAKVGIEGSLIRIFRDKDNADQITFSIEMDPRINDLNIKSLVKICPAEVFEIESSDKPNNLKESKKTHGN